MSSFRTIATAAFTLTALVAPITADAATTIYVATIEVTRTSDSALLGYVGTNTIGLGLSQISPIGNALQVAFTMNSSATFATGLDLLAQNSSTGFANFGLIQGRDDADSFVMPGSFQYLYVSLTNPTPAGSTPQTVGNSYTGAGGISRTSESAVWTIDLTTGSLVPVWTNPDGSTPTLDLFSQSNALYAGGDSAQFLGRYPSPITPYSFSLNILSQTSVDGAVPEPSTWAMMLLGFGFVGGAMRTAKRRQKIAISYA
jgi:hypothetical protein